MHQSTVSFATVETTAGVAMLPQDRQSCSHDSLVKKKPTMALKAALSQINWIVSFVSFLLTLRLGKPAYTQQTSIEK